VEHFFRDFNHRDMYNHLLEFLKQVSLEGAEQREEVNQIKLVILRVNAFRVRRLVGRRRGWFLPLESGVAISPGRNSSREIPYLRGVPNTEIKFADLNVNTVAEQLTYQVHRIFQSIHAGELFKLEWKSAKAKKTSPHVLASIDKFNMISGWVSTEIVMLQSPKLRAVAIERFIQLGQKLLELRNFDSLLAVISGLSHNSVSRLKKTWPLVGQPSTDAFDDLNVLVDTKKNYMSYRDTLKKASLPAVPYAGLYLRDITFLEEGNSDKIGDMVNFEKIQMYGKIFKEVQFYQRGRYPIVEDENMQVFLRKFNVMPEDLLDKQSQAIEPIGS